MNNYSQRTSRIRRALLSTAILGILGLSAVGLTQCRLVDDSVTGVSIDRQTQKLSGRSSGRRDGCFDKCNRAFRDARITERERHEAAIRKCDALRGDKRADCKTAERKLHRANIQKIEQQKRTCKRNCYHEGSGGGGR